MTSTIDNNYRTVKIHCAICGRTLKFDIKNDAVIENERGIIAVNIPCAVCNGCVDSLLDRVADLPGIVRVDGLSPILAREILEGFTFLLPKPEAANFFASLFPDIGREEAV